ncbi:MAG: type II toxin-antitoxin system RelE/ParE family toxin [Kaistella sp.]
MTKDKPCAARRFKTDLSSEIGKIPERHLSYRKSTFFEVENKREIIFKRYRIVFEIKDSRILVFGF